MEYSEAVLKSEVVPHELACKDVHDKGLSEKQKQKKPGVRCHQDSDDNINNNKTKQNTENRTATNT